MQNQTLMKTKFELAHVIGQFADELLAKFNPAPLHLKVLNKILLCRSAALGGHEEKCDSCAKIRYSYNSCGDRHCPKCQAAKQALWIEKILHTTLPIKHYHIIFTVPHVLNKICLYNNRMFYNLFFNAVWKTLQSFGYTHYGVESGAICVLHSWGQNLSLHPHIHCIVPAAGYTMKGEWKNMGTYDNYLYPVHQLSNAFLGKFLDGLKRELRKINRHAQFKPLIDQAYSKKWVVYCEPSLARAEHVIRYLGQYTHRVAISNHRILNITKSHVTFIAKDYRDRAIKKPVSLKGEEFLRRFCQHILPKRFVKIRRYGIYNHTTKQNLDLQFTPQEKPNITGKEIPDKTLKETAQERLKRLTGFDVYQCPYCKKGIMKVIREIPRIRSPTDFYLPISKQFKI